MCVNTSIWVLYTVMFLLNTGATAVRLYPCDSFGYRDVEENTAVTFHCDQYYNGNIDWRYAAPGFSEFGHFSKCDAEMCTQPGGSIFTVTYISAGNNSLTSTLTSRSLDQAGGEYKCGAETCTVRIIVPASVSTPTSSITRTDQGYYLHCQTSIVKVYSSKGQYSCVWQNGTTQVNGTLKLQPPPHDTNNTSDRMGTCNVTLQLSNPSDAICNVTVSPGNTIASSRIVRPSHPEISCPTIPVPDKTNITCTCSTDNLGQPGGRLAWYTGTNGVFGREIVRGSFDVNSLTMTWPVARSDHNVTMFRCVNEWIENVNASTDFTVNGDALYADVPEAERSVVVIIAGSIGGLATVVCVAVAVVCVKKRTNKERLGTQSFDQSVQHNAGRSDVSIIARTAGETSSTYQELVVAEVGVPSNYEQLSRYGNIRPLQPESRDNPSFGAYESLQSADVGQSSVYSEMTHGSGPVYGNSSTPNK